MYLVLSGLPCKACPAVTTALQSCGLIAWMALRLSTLKSYASQQMLSLMEQCRGISTLSVFG